MYRVASGLSVELLVCPQLVRQYVRCDMIMAFMYNLAEFNVIVFFMYLKFARLNFALWVTFLTCVLNVKLESIIIPRYLT